MENKIRDNFPLGFTIGIKELLNTYLINVKFPKSFVYVECIGGDWGSSYRLAIDPNDLIQISYKSGCCNEENYLTCELREIYLKTPFLFKERNEAPFYMELPILENKSTLHISLTPNLTICHVIIVENTGSEQKIRNTEILEICA